MVEAPKYCKHGEFSNYGQYIFNKQRNNCVDFGQVPSVKRKSVKVSWFNTISKVR
jgi:hypothetical protein